MPLVPQRRSPSIAPARNIREGSLSLEAIAKRLLALERRTFPGTQAVIPVSNAAALAAASTVVDNSSSGGQTPPDDTDPVATDGVTIAGDGVGSPLHVISFPGSGAYVYNASGQNIANGFSLTALAFPTKLFDDASFWSSGANTELTIPVSGLYGFGAFVQWSAFTGGQRALVPQVNAAALSGSPGINMPADADPNAVAMSMNIAAYRLNAGDVITWLVAQDSTSNPLATLTAAASIAFLGR